MKRYNVGKQTTILKYSQLLQLKGGTGNSNTAQEIIIIEDIDTA